jgi:hypothetical protein
MLIKKEKNTDLFIEREGSYEELGDPVKFQMMLNDSSLKYMPVKGINREVKY